MRLTAVVVRSLPLAGAASDRLETIAVESVEAREGALAVLVRVAVTLALAEERGHIHAMRRGLCGMVLGAGSANVRRR